MVQSLFFHYELVDFRPLLDLVFESGPVESEIQVSGEEDTDQMSTVEYGAT